ncbi:putative long-chain-alcohol oxidase [[Candida] railenensis]|uniref:Long-chain-alcohol oxidase n=1 Tax=[Candida] railenensis TaxID=45579 RepID=A0A9P0QS79_9ASCO|nr:putative long-chain-alcohol oxidase [[Candida] railenensis]
MFEKVEEKHLDIFLLLADAIAHEIAPEDIASLVSPDFPKEKLDEYCRTATKLSDFPGAKEYVMGVINKNSSNDVRDFIILVTLLDSRVGGPILTNSLTPIRDMTLKEREDLLNSWKSSPLSIKNKLFKLFYSLSILAFTFFVPEIHNEAIGYPGREVREVLYEGQQLAKNDTFRYEMLSPPSQDGNELYIPGVDVLIVGSGSGAGVVAHTLANEGYKCLVIEKGQYYSRSDFNFTDKEGIDKLYDQGGCISSSDTSTTVLAGSTFGGGSTVNWSASLKTPFKVRKEWYDDYGLEWAASEKFDNAMDYVLNQMGVTTKGVNHSFSNQVILDGSSKLGYDVKVVPQNIGNHENHDCGSCYLGCKFGVKQGSLECWFRDAQSKGTQFMTGVKVLKLIHRGGKATAALCENVANGNRFTITGPKKFIVASGSLQTPIVLQNSGFKNKNIGSNLKLHPVSLLFGDFGTDKITKPYNHPILTTVCSEVADLDGKAHGARIETTLHAPYLTTSFLPWNSSTSLRQNIMKYNNMSAILLITRDVTSGKIRSDPYKPESFILDYSPNQFDRDAIKESLLIAADLLYIEGAKEIIHPKNGVESFKSEKPKESRSIDDKDFVSWRNKVSKIDLTIYKTTFGSAHQMSSCRMSGKGPKYGACDSNGKLFEASNVYVADSSTMPTASGVNPMVTTMSIARLVALNVIEDLKPKAKI